MRFVSLMIIWGAEDDKLTSIQFWTQLSSGVNVLHDYEQNDQKLIVPDNKLPAGRPLISREQKVCKCSGGSQHVRGNALNVAYAFRRRPAGAYV